MKVKAINILFVFLVTISLSCRHTQTIQVDSIQGGKILKIETSAFRYRGEKHKNLVGIAYNDKKIVCSYTIGTKCGCAGKIEYAPKITRYELTTNHNFDLPLNETDKLVFKKFTSLPQIETYCSKTLLDSAKGFIKD